MKALFRPTLFKIIVLVVDMLSWLYPLILASVASVFTGLLVKAVSPFMSSVALWASLPLFYLLWLFFFVATGAIATSIIFFNFKKPSKLTVDLSFSSSQDLRTFLDAARIFSMYRTSLFMHRLPMLNYALLPPIVFGWLNRLVLRAYSPSINIDGSSMLISNSQDPDLTHVGRNVVIGSNCQIVCHALNNSGGYLKYASAPVQIGDEATVGGNSNIGMGVSIGKGAVVEMGSNVLPYTRIAPYEVWGGNPAVCLRQISTNNNVNVSTHSRSVSSDHLSPSSADVAAVNAIIAAALHIQPHQVTPSLSSETCGDWDSLAKMAIAAALFDRYGIQVLPSQINSLSSQQSIQQLIAASQQASRNAQPLPVAHLPVAHLPVAQREQPQSLPRDPELLPLEDSGMATRLLAQSLPQSIDSNEPDQASNQTDEQTKSLCIAATFTAQPLASALSLWSRAFHLPVSTDFLEYNQIEQILLTPTSAFYTNSPGLNIVLVRPEDLISPSDPEGKEKGAQIIGAIRHYAQQRPGLIVSDLPPITSELFTGSAAQAETLRSWWNAELADIPNVRKLGFASIIEDLGRQQARDTALETIARAPYSQTAYQQLGIAIARLVRQTYLPPKKVIALDCDNTLWGGVIGEDNLGGIALSDDHPGRSFRLFQAALRSLQKLGILLVLVSKNEVKDVWQVFDHHPQMLLQREDIAGHRVNWQAKSANLRELAKELNLGLDAFVFIDDSPTERLEVSTNAPEVTVLPMPTDPMQYVATLNKLWCFDTTRVTAEDTQRTQYMQQDQKRQQLQNSGPSLESYLQALQLEIDIRPAVEADLARVAQLTQKTNQFNLSLTRRSLTEIQTLSADNSIWTLSVKDRFGDYGLVGVAIVKPVEVAQSAGCLLLIDTFLMSCRALGRGVEVAFMAHLFEVAQQQEATQLIAPFAVGPRNSQVKAFLNEAGFEQKAEASLEVPLKADSEMPLEVFAASADPLLPCPAHISRALVPSPSSEVSV